MRRSLAIVLGFGLGLGLTGAACAETEMDCAALTETLQALSGYTLAIPTVPMGDGWCVVDAARLKASGRPDLAARQLRLTGKAADGEPTDLQLEIEGLKLVLRPGGPTVPDWLQATLRLQSADLRVSLLQDLPNDTLKLRAFDLALSGGTKLSVEAQIQGARLETASLLTGALTELQLRWKSDGRSLRPAVEAAGAAIGDAVGRSGPVDAVREVLQDIVAAVPASTLPDGSRVAAKAAVRALPQGRGWLTVELTSEPGIGIAALGALALSDDPTGPEALARFFAGTSMDIDWRPGLGP